MSSDPVKLGKALEAGAGKDVKPASKPLPRLGYKSNARQPARMSHGNVQKFIPSKEQH